MAYNTPYTPYAGYQEINYCLERSELDALVKIQEHENGLVYVLYLDGEILGRSSSLAGLLHKISSEFGAVFMRQHFLKSKLEKQGINNL
jgi:hypothetical protein